MRYDMKIELLSSKYKVKQIEEKDIQDVYLLCKSNPLYYQFCPPYVTIDSIKNDLTALPQGKTLDDKYYVGFYQDQILVAVMDIIDGYPHAETAFIGFFMMNQKMQGSGIGTAALQKPVNTLKQLDFPPSDLGI